MQISPIPNYWPTFSEVLRDRVNGSPAVDGASDALEIATLDQCLLAAEETGRRLHLVAPIPSFSNPVQDPALQERCRQAASAIVKTANLVGLHIRFQLVEGLPALAGALADGTIVIDRGRVTKLSPESLLFLMGHEIGHLAARDHQTELGRNEWLNDLLSSPRLPDPATGNSDQSNLQGQSMAADFFAQTLLGLTQPTQSGPDIAQVSEKIQARERGCENAADAFGARVSASLGIDPEPAAREVFNLLYADPAHSPIATHGSLEERLSIVRQAAVQVAPRP